MKRLLLVDDHQIILDGLSEILGGEDTIEIVGHALNGKEALNELSKQPVDILCMDIEMPVMDGIEATKVVKEKYPNVKILILSMYNRPELVKQLANIGVDGFVKKDAGKLELLLAIDHLARNDTYYSQHFTQSLIESQKTTESQVQLTIREQEVLERLADGDNTVTIAEKLFISTHTVQSHRKNLLSKFGVNNATSLIREATQLGLLSK